MLSHFALISISWFQVLNFSGLYNVLNDVGVSSIAMIYSEN